MNHIQKIYFIGIGGIGMSALARYFNNRNLEVFGYDRTATTLTRTLEAEGMSIHYEDDISQIPEGIDLVVYTPAIPKDHKELNYFIDGGYPIKKRAEVLGLISQKQRTIAVSGTHGKTTTSSILTHLLRVGGIDCTAFLGGIANNIQSNFIDGQDDWVVVEADEYDRSFLQLYPQISIVLSMDADHLDIYGDGQSVKNGFSDFVRQTKSDGSIIVNKNWVDQLDTENLLAEVKDYGLGQADFYADNIRVENGYFVFDYLSENHKIENLLFTLPGHHNVENATAAISVALQLGVQAEDIRKALASFKGIKRRFETVYRDEKVVYIDDYAHHPSELKAAIHSVKTLFPNKKITGVFQPHLYSRTRDFLDGFAKELSVLDEVILLDIYPARELPIEGITSKVIFDKITSPSKVLTNKSALMDEVKKLKPEILVTLGAGDIDTFIAPIKKYLSNG